MILFIAGVLLSIPISIAANLVTPRVRTWLATRSRKRRVKRIEQIIRRVKQIEELRNGSTNRLIAHVASRIVWNMGNFFLALVFSASIPVLLNMKHPTTAAYVWSVLGTILVYLATFSAIQTRRFLKRIRDFEDYRNTAERELERLGGYLPENLTDSTPA